MARFLPQIHSCHNNMRIMRDIHGVTLLETVIYIGLLTVLVSAYIGILTQLTTIQDRQSISGRLAESATLALDQVTQFTENAQSITVSTSTLGTSTSVLQFKDATGTAVTIDTVIQTINFSGINQNVRRLRYIRGGQTYYLTDTDVNVVTWQVDDVRTTSNALSGLNFTLELEILNEQSSGYRQGTVRQLTSVSFYSLTIEQ